jgi:type I restriction enzyme M protein
MVTIELELYMSNAEHNVASSNEKQKSSILDYVDSQKKSIQTNSVSEAKLEPESKISKECLDTSKKNKELKELFDSLWKAADELRANSALRSTQYSTPVLGLIFLRYADHKFEEATQVLQKELASHDHPIRKLDYQAKGIVYLTEKARYKYLLDLPEEAGIGKAIDDTMRNIEAENEELRDVLPKVYINIGDKVLENLLKLFHIIPTELDQDIFGKIYEYFLGEFAKSEGQGAGEFYTPTSIVRLIVEVLEPYHGRILDPACGSGGMFVQSAEFVKNHLKNPYKEISIYGQEKTDDTVRLCKMNLAVHGLSGDIKQGNTYYEDVFNMQGKFDFVMANPPFNVNNVDKEAVRADPRYGLGLPASDNANYLWIQIFHSMLNENGRTGFVMAHAAIDASHSEREIRRKLVERGIIDAIISIAPNFFYTVALPVTLWFMDNGKKNTSTKNTTLFIDARNIYDHIDRAHRQFTPRQIEFISNIVRLYRGKKIETTKCSLSLIKEHFPNLRYQDVNGLCKVATLEDIRNQKWSLNPGRYVGVVVDNLEVDSFRQKIKELQQKLVDLNEESVVVNKRIDSYIRNLLENEY